MYEDLSLPSWKLGCWFALRRCVGTRCQVVECLNILVSSYYTLFSHYLTVYYLVTLVDCHN